MRILSVSEIDQIAGAYGPPAGYTQPSFASCQFSMSNSGNWFNTAVYAGIGAIGTALTGGTAGAIFVGGGAGFLGSFTYSATC